MKSLPQAVKEVRWVVGVDAHQASFTYVLLQCKARIEEVVQGELPSTPAGYAPFCRSWPVRGPWWWSSRTPEAMPWACAGICCSSNRPFTTSRPPR